jgi:hypothetical protein
MNSNSMEKKWSSSRMDMCGGTQISDATHITDVCSTRISGDEQDTELSKHRN